MRWNYAATHTVFYKIKWDSNMNNEINYIKCESKREISKVFWRVIFF